MPSNWGPRRPKVLAEHLNDLFEILVVSAEFSKWNLVLTCSSEISAVLLVRISSQCIHSIPSNPTIHR